MIDDCPILTRFGGFLVDQGVCATLEYVFRDRIGNPIDLATWLANSSDSLSESTSEEIPSGLVKARIKEWLGTGYGPRNPLWTVYGEAVDATEGVVQLTLPAGVVEQAAIYEIDWAVVNESNRPMVVNRSVLSVEKSMWPQDLRHVYANLGPPTIQEIRMRLMDSSRSENLLLDDVEFKDEQILMAMWEPIRFWNEQPPPLRPIHTTRTFPFRGAWVSGILGQLHLMAANHYRRNTMRGAAGATSDKDKEREYLGEGQRLWGEYTAWVQNKKLELNVRLMAGQVVSSYSTASGW
jgi:hypothetical protein